MRQDGSVSRPVETPENDAGTPTAGNPAVARWLQRTLVADPPRARSLIVTVWGDALAPHGGTVWLSGLIRLMAPFGINDRLVRTSVFRLARDGWLASAAHGRRSRYRLTAQGGARFDAAYRRIYMRPDDEWNGAWEIVLADRVPPSRRAALRNALAWSGYGALNATTYLRPARADAALAPHAWTLPTLAADYRHFLKRFGGVIERFGSGEPHDPAQCFAVRTLLIHAYRRVLLRDPLLPAALLPLDWPGAAAYALCRDFYRRTHRCAERHLVGTLAADGDMLPPANAAFQARFGGLVDD
jgi:phenylacetic acid degradation operon negative regulatory protein